MPGRCRLSQIVTAVSLLAELLHSNSCRHLQALPKSPTAKLMKFSLPMLSHNSGCACRYRSGDFDGALESFRFW